MFSKGIIWVEQLIIQVASLLKQLPLSRLFGFCPRVNARICSYVEKEQQMAVRCFFFGIYDTASWQFLAAKLGDILVFIDCFVRLQVSEFRL